ncbi:MAG TPA: STAS domain-containing protein [Pseudonocardia sp.]|jgi:anti-sigma B factor antagonist|uniref:STAS domain-containing protein n=1 Tax=Pseudonocardia sp. TaxID=60912 RepID=UPI002B4AE192|nr:STAS domain-containing protein [Pseudonocardia sp.]HLU56968.1 STAS domain-containing protein [Pseudonocardia sp.]
MNESTQPCADFLETSLTRPRPGAVVLTVRGEIDTLTAPEFTAATDELLTSSGEILVMDLTDVRFLASSGLAVLISAAHRAEDRGTRLRLVVTSRAVRRPLEITGTAGMFDLYPDPESACGGRD